MELKVAYLGPKGTFSEEAAQKYCQKKQVSLLPCSSVAEIVKLIENCQMDEGIVPIETSYGGQVTTTLDVLAESKRIKIRRALTLPVEQYLLTGKNTRPEELTAIYSHPQAFSQCYHYCRDNFPRAVLVETVSTAEGAVKVAQSTEPWGAIGSKRLAEQYDLNIVAKINDSVYNTTCFLVLGREEVSGYQEVKTSIILSLNDSPGSLFDILREFAYANINLTKIESRPSKTKLGEYKFFIDFLGSRDEPQICKVLASIKDKANLLINLGSYPFEAPSGLKEKVCPHQQATYLNSIPDIRKDIDILDRQIIDLLSKRAELVNMMSKLKETIGKIRDAAREKEVLARVRNIAEEKAVDAGFIETLYRQIIEHCVALQVNELKKEKSFSKQI